MQFGTRYLDLDSGVIMAVMNITPDSFSDGGQLYRSGRPDWDAIYHRAEFLIESGADILDVGGESTRPGANAVSLQEELSRVVPVIEGLAKRFDCVLSVDTSSADVMRESVSAGAGMINDVRGLSRDGALAAAVSARVPVCLMHMRGKPSTMQDKPQYEDVVEEVSKYLAVRVEAFLNAGGLAKSIVLDPGFGFGKTFEHNVALFKSLNRVCALGYPVLAGVSRKAMIGEITGAPPEGRAIGSAVAAALAIKNGAKIVRVHDVAETLQAKQVLEVLGNFDG